MTQQAENTAAIAENDKRITVHEAVCAARYVAIDDKLERGNKRFDKLDKYFTYLGVAVIFNTVLNLLGPGVAALFVKNLFGM